jgi:4-amino-4-deoxy-L-arabinose transferase-like glycosyltransferase
MARLGRGDCFWTVTLLGVALLVFLLNLGELPLKDWDEALVAQVARDIWRDLSANGHALTWLHPTLGGVPYLNKPPLVHWLIALAYAIGGVQEWTARFPGAVLTAISVPVLFHIGREIFPKRSAAILAALVYVTFIPVVRLGRMAMLDGALLCGFLVLLLCVLKARRDLRWSWGIGLAFGALCLTKGIVGLLLGAIALGFVLWDTPRLLTAGYVWAGVVLGTVPVMGWYGAQGLHYGAGFWTTHFIDQALSRSNQAVDGNRGSFGYYALEVLKYGAPWLVFLPQGWRLLWENRRLSWAKLLLVWSVGYFGVISVMATKLPWYVLPLYPALALTVGAQLAELWNLEDFLGIRYRLGDAAGAVRSPAYRSLWSLSLGAVAIAGWGATIYFGGYFSGYGGGGVQPAMPEVQVLCGAIALTMSVAALLIYRQDSQFILVLLWGMYVSLILFVRSPYWVWELGEDYPVKPVAALVRQNTSPGQPIYTSYNRHRPSLNFYSDRSVLPLPLAQIKQRGQEPSALYLLVKPAEIPALQLPSYKILGESEGWTLLARPTS